MSREDDLFAASEMKHSLKQLQGNEINARECAEQLHYAVMELTMIPAAWKDKLLELCHDLAASEDKKTSKEITTRMEKAIALIRD